MLNFTKKIVDFVFMKKKAPVNPYANCVARGNTDSLFAYNYMYDRKNGHDDIKARQDSGCRADDDDFVKIPPFVRYRVCSRTADSDVVKKDTNGDLIRYMSKCAFYGLINSYLLVPIMYNALSGAYRKKPIEDDDDDDEDDEPVNRINKDYEYDFIDKTFDLEDHLKVPPKKQEDQDDEFDVVESLQEIVKQQEDDEIDSLIKTHSQRYPMEAVVLENLRDHPDLVREFVSM